MAGYSYNDGLQNAGRTPKLWVVLRGQIHTFTGSAIAGVVAVSSTEYEKKGKWSSTTYRLELTDGVTPCYLLAPMHGQVWPENDRMSAYRRFMQEFKVTISFEVFDATLLRDYPDSHARMLEGEKALESLDTPQVGDTELVEISTSQPNNRTPHDDVRVSAPDGRSWIVAYNAPKGTEIPCVCKLVETKYTPGYRGGTDTLIFATSAGVKIEGAYYYKDDEPFDWALGRNGSGVAPAS